MSVPQHIIQRVVENALAEDLGLAGDITAAAIFDDEHMSVAHFMVKGDGIICGLEVIALVCQAVDPSIEVSTNHQDGDPVGPRTAVATVEGPTRSLLIAERTALNLLSRLSGIATLTAKFVNQTIGTDATIVDTRKTTPGLRALEKYAVRCGGGKNHRFGLFDAILIKDNHIAAAGSVTLAVQKAKASVGHTVKIEVEVDSMEKLDELLTVGADIVMLDNMNPEQASVAVQRISGRMLTEASGRMSLESVRAYAEAGVNLISVGALTHSAPILDVSLEFEGS